MRTLFDLEIVFDSPQEGICGVDEVGRGPLAGPVVAAAVLPDPRQPIAGLADSKVLNAAQRDELAGEIRAKWIIALGAASLLEIEHRNILHASMLAMERAVARLPLVPRHILIDGNRLPGRLPCPATALVKGDALAPAISAAAIVAKVARDRTMRQLGLRYPGYGWETNAGYGTAEHLDALKRLGTTPHHRLRFAPVAALMAGEATEPRYRMPPASGLEDRTWPGKRTTAA
ncbi:ribonuclease HII [Marinibaculum pumilum]|uniref:Ribonuclease HII n=1 Tax=Marinibaculum pumilum TaxID=1766165 RepID=A0ABV7KW10_9PROT